MSEENQHSQEDSTAAPEAQPKVSQRPVRWYRRIGCLLGLLVWLVVMLIPLLFIALAVRQEIVITQGDAPGQVLRIWLINEARHRGLGISTASVYADAPEEGVCVQTDVRFLLWMGESDPTSYCECYVRAGDSLEFTGATEGQCVP